MITKDDFHKLIDTIEDEQALKRYFSLILHLNNNQSGELWNSLSSEEKEELLLSYEESLDPVNLMRHDQIKNQYNQWLRK